MAPSLTSRTNVHALAVVWCRGDSIGKVVADPYREIDFSHGKRGPVVAPDPGKTKISIRLDNDVLDHFRHIVDAAGGGNYQTLINDALVAHIHQQSMLVAVRKVVREEIAKVTGRYAGACHPASAHSSPLTAELMSMKQIASAISSGRISRLNWVNGNMCLLM